MPGCLSYRLCSVRQSVLDRLRGPNACRETGLQNRWQQLADKQGRSSSCAGASKELVSTTGPEDWQEKLVNVSESGLSTSLRAAIDDTGSNFEAQERTESPTRLGLTPMLSGLGSSQSFVRQERSSSVVASAEAEPRADQPAGRHLQD